MYLAIYEANNDMHLSAYLLLCMNEVPFTVGVHGYIYILWCAVAGYIHHVNCLH